MSVKLATIIQSIQLFLDAFLIIFRLLTDVFTITKLAALALIIFTGILLLAIGDPYRLVMMGI